MSFDLANVVDTLGVQDVGDGRYHGDSYDIRYHRVFGGQVLGQAICALTAAGAGKTVKSLTHQFVREGDTSLPLEFAVSTVGSGRSFATCTVEVRQGSRIIGMTTANLHVLETGLEQHDTAPDVGAPEDSPLVDLRIVPWETRVVDGIDLEDPAVRPSTYRFWMRASELPDLTDASPQWLHQALLAHASEPSLIGTALLPVEGWSQGDAHVRFTSAVLSHSLWFHQPFRVDEWLLLDQHGPIVTGGRGYGRADVWTVEGRLVASFAQESLIRCVQEDSEASFE